MIKIKWRLLNLGEISWLRTQAIYHALGLNLSNNENILILNWPNKPFISIGLHQLLDLSVEISFAELNKLPIVRRSCGGGSVYLDSNQLFYQIICDKNNYPFELGRFYQFFLKPVIETYRFFNIPAEYSPINDIIANGRKISGNGAVSINNAKILVGNFIFEFPAKEMAKILKLSDEKFRDKVTKSMEERMGSFKHFLDTLPSKEEVSEIFIEKFSQLSNIELIEDTLKPKELEKIEEIERLYKDKNWLYYVEEEGDEIFQQKIKSGTYFLQTEKKFKGGLVQLFIHFENGKIADIIISGDFTISPPFVLVSIQKMLIGTPVQKNLIYSNFKEVFEKEKIDLPGISIDQLTDLIMESFYKLKK